MSQLEKALEKQFTIAKNEREIQPFLKNNSIIVRNALNIMAWNYSDIISEFQMGSQYRTDFLILSANSGSWNVVIVELKSHRVHPFTKAGVPSKYLNVALKELDDCERWINRYENQFRMDISRYFESKNIPACCSSADRHTKAATEIIDPRTSLRKYFYVVIGRRLNMTIEDQERRASYSYKNIEIVTYDRLLEAARKLDNAKST